MIKIRKNKQIAKNIKMNTKSYKPGRESADVAQGIMEKIMVLVLGITTPFFAILSSINVLFRIPDFYRFEFDRMEVSRKLDLGIGNTDLGGFFSDFMLHSKDEFSLVAEFQGIERELFTFNEATVMASLRSLLDVFLIFAVATFFITVFLIVVLQYNRMSRELRRGLNIGLVIYICLIAALVGCFNFTGADTMLIQACMDMPFGKEDLLQQMFDGRLTLDTTVAVVAVSFIIMVIIRYIVWKLTAQRGVFSEALRGVSK